MQADLSLSIQSSSVDQADTRPRTRSNNFKGVDPNMVQTILDDIIDR